MATKKYMATTVVIVPQRRGPEECRSQLPTGYKPVASKEQELKFSLRPCVPRAKIRAISAFIFLGKRESRVLDYLSNLTPLSAFRGSF